MIQQFTWNTWILAGKKVSYRDHNKNKPKIDFYKKLGCYLMLGETSLHILLWRETDTSFCFVSLSIFSTNLNKSVIKFLIFHSKSQAGSCIILIGKIYFSAWNLCKKGWQNIILQGINLSSWLQLWWLWESFNVLTQYFRKKEAMY